jgi:hypothetical protein
MEVEASISGSLLVEATDARDVITRRVRQK